MPTPKLSEADVRAIVTANRSDASKFCMVSIRGFYLESMGKPSANDRGIYDDATFLVTPRGVVAYQSNTDPSRNRDGIATLCPGIHRYGTGRHKGRVAFRQAEKVTVVRDGQAGRQTGWYAINIHDGGVANTSSLGCQTIPAGTWNQFRTLSYEFLEEYENPWGTNDWGQRVRTFDYILIEEENRRAGHLVVSNRYF